MTALLSVDGLHVSYGKVEAVSGASLEMQTGQIVTVIGPNGAGKTTLLAALMGLLPSRGGLRYEGNDLHALSTEERVRRGICLVPERRELFTEMTAEDNLILGAYTRWKDRDAVRSDLTDVYARFPRLSERRKQLAGRLAAHHVAAAGRGHAEGRVRLPAAELLHRGGAAESFHVRAHPRLERGDVEALPLLDLHGAAELVHATGRETSVGVSSPRMSCMRVSMAFLIFGWGRT